jgi:hypothetical protein
VQWRSTYAPRTRCPARLANQPTGGPLDRYLPIGIPYHQRRDYTTAAAAAATAARCRGLLVVARLASSSMPCRPCQRSLPAAAASARPLERRPSASAPNLYRDDRGRGTVGCSADPAWIVRCRRQCSGPGVLVGISTSPSVRASMACRAVGQRFSVRFGRASCAASRGRNITVDQSATSRWIPVLF